ARRTGTFRRLFADVDMFLATMAVVADGDLLGVLVVVVLPVGTVLGMGYLAIAMVVSASIMVAMSSMGSFLFHYHDFLVAMMMPAVFHDGDVAAGRLADDHDLAGLRTDLFHHDDLGTLFHHHHGGLVYGPGTSPFRAHGHDAAGHMLDPFDMAG